MKNKNLKLIIAFFLLVTFQIFSNPKGQVVILNGTSTAGKSMLTKDMMKILGKSYEKVSIDDFFPEIFIEQKVLKSPEEEFLKRLDQKIILMYDKVKKIAQSGKNVIVDTVLSALRGAESEKLSFQLLEELNTTLVLAYCPLTTLAERVKQRNKKAFLENKEEGLRVFVDVVNFHHIYKVQESDKEICIDTLSFKDLEQVYKTTNNTPYEAAKRSNTVKHQLLSYFCLDINDSVNITPKLSYDYIVDTSKYDSQKCAQLICEYLERHNPIKQP